MKILLNNIPTVLPNDFMSVADLLEWKHLNKPGTAVAINSKIIRKENWSLTRLSDFDNVSVITAAFGG